MRKAIMSFLVLTILVASVSAVLAQPGPWKSKNKNIEVIPYSNGETLLRLWTGDGGFQLWITGNRELHCVYKLEGQNDGDGWLPSSWEPDYVYKCEPYD